MAGCITIPFAVHPVLKFKGYKGVCLPRAACKKALRLVGGLSPGVRFPPVSARNGLSYEQER